MAKSLTTPTPKWRSTRRSESLHTSFGSALAYLATATRHLKRLGGFGGELEDAEKILGELRALRNQRRHTPEVVEAIRTLNRVSGKWLNWHEAMYRLEHHGMCPGLPQDIRDEFTVARQCIDHMRSLAEVLQEERDKDAETRR